METLTNWAGNLRYAARRVVRPSSVDELCAVVARSERLRVVGSRHSFNRVADTDGDLVSLERLPGTVAIEAERACVAVAGQVAYGALSAQLDAAGVALHNLASLPHILVAGAIATATHGSGDRLQNLASAVIGIEFVNAHGELVTLTRDEHGGRFPGAVVHLGGLGVVTRVTLRVEPTYRVRQWVYERLPLDTALANFDAVTGAATSVSLFTDWRAEAFTQVWLKQRVGDREAREPAGDFFGAPRATGALHPIATVSPASCTVQGGEPGPWFERWPHFRMDFTPSAGDELQSEYLVPRTHAPAALRAVAALREAIAPLLQVCEVRTIAADDLWMSPCYQRDCVGIHFTWRPDWNRVRKLLPAIETALAPFDARPHWGKLFTTPPEVVRGLYEKRADFCALLREHDPDGKFRNAFMDTYVFGPGADADR